MFDTIILFHVIAPFILTSSQKQLCKAELSAKPWNISA